MKCAYSFMLQLFKARDLVSLQQLLNKEGDCALWDRVPVFSSDIPKFDGVQYLETFNCNLAVSGYSGEADFAIVSWDAESFLVANCADYDQPLFIIPRVEFWKRIDSYENMKNWKGGNLN